LAIASRFVAGSVLEVNCATATSISMASFRQVPPSTLVVASGSSSGVDVGAGRVVRPAAVGQISAAER
jgi:hypothetical protein